jgi:uncharacterized membrane protein
MFSLFKRKPIVFFSEEERNTIVNAVKTAETNTSGEIRVYVESRCRFVDAIDRAIEVFSGLGMQQTDQRNAVLVYVALKDKQLAIFADDGIYTKAGKQFWNDAVRNMLQHFNKENYAAGIAHVVEEIGSTLSHHFPYDAATDKNELPDDIVFGK